MKKTFLMLALLFSKTMLSQRVGIGTNTPLEKLHVAGNIKTDTIKTDGINLKPNAAAGKILASDASGNANWQTAGSTIGGNIGFGVWGDCATTGNISEYLPVVDATGSASDYFGRSAAMSGNYAIAGSYSDDIGGNSNQGSASIYKFDGNTWVLMQKITDATGAADDYFGWSVSVSGNFAIVGAYTDNNGTVIDQGSASIYQFNGSSWVLMQKLTDATGSTDDYFGYSVSISGNYAIVGAYADDVGANADQGSVSIYQYNGTAWVLMQKITEAAGSVNDDFGFAVSLSGSYAVVTVPGDEVGANTDQGSANIYQLSGGNWVLMQKITDPNGSASDFLGSSVSVSGNYIIVGAQADDAPNLNQGSATVFQYNGSTWSAMQRFIDEEGASNDYFGQSVTISGNYAMVGAYFDDINTHTDQGAVSLYMRVGPGWKKLLKIKDPGGNSNDFFGASCALDYTTQRFIIGAHGFGGYSGNVIFGKIN
jgi:hypothetical protein